MRLSQQPISYSVSGANPDEIGPGFPIVSDDLVPVTFLPLPEATPVSDARFVAPLAASAAREIRRGGLVVRDAPSIGEAKITKGGDASGPPAVLSVQGARAVARRDEAFVDHLHSGILT